ncbi:methanogenesis marker radical SAM protein [Methanomicrobium sp. W14]|uniref:methyl coenzyme M reductase-arginine methyltransferase Mmp10 n=1 Tax=Methanomicrobium sp. W14 TaxID=2817839 RepID=UPI001AEA6AEB|nr:methyl coenzyme M reductase-arginine methyltransferase Mmp10 [Methanomicrobium sp. W14]MBP2133233.1 methanogenesis marker radical SAM protein [Methanomicrobium sp. W14]
MAHLTVDIGGSPGIDCRGFCSYCYFKRLKKEENPEPFGCKYCLPFTKGCDYCTNGVRENYEGFKDIRDVADNILADLQLMDGELEKITISGGGDPSCYPQFKDLMEILGSMEVPIHIGYTSGKGFDDPDIADFMVDNGLSEISYTIFASDPKLRSEYMVDPTPKASLEVFRRLCKKIDVYAAAVIIPDVNDGEALEDTCRFAEECGAKGIILMRFANRTDQGLILGNAPIIKGQRVQTVREFAEMVISLNSRYKIKINGTPLGDPEIGSPFAITDEPDLLEKLPRVEKDATIITGSIAARPIQTILDACGNKSWVYGTQKEIACLITIDDLKSVDLSKIGEVVIIPGRSFVHEKEATEVLSSDGVERTVIRGPDMLTADAETSMGMDKNGVLQMEMDGFSELIRLMNMYGRDRE